MLCCRTVLPSDLQYLTDQDIEEIGATLTHVEMMRLQAALQALRGAPASTSSLVFARRLFSARKASTLACAEEGQAAAGTE